jgi:hypothetical protein
MKKLFYIIMFALTVSLTVTSCAEEEIQPTMDNGGGVGLEGKP